MLYKASKHAEIVAKSFIRRHNWLHIILQTFIDDFRGQSVRRFNDETLRFKREQTREIVHASCLNFLSYKIILFLNFY